MTSSRRALWAVVTALLGGLLLHPQAAFAQSDCTITSAQVPSLTVVRGETDKLVLDTGDAATLTAMKAAGAGCNKTAIQYLRVETASGTNGVNGTDRPTPVTVTSVSGTGSKFTVTGSQIRYTPGSGVGTTESLSPATGTYSSNTGGPYTDTFHFYHTSQSAGHYYSVQVTIVAPDAPTAALTSLSPNPGYVGGAVTVTVMLTNPNSTAALSGVGDSITLPSGITFAANGLASNNCGFTNAPMAGAASVSLAGGSISAGSTCSFSFSVAAASSGTYSVNPGTPSASGANAGAVGGAQTLTINAPVTIAAAFSPASVTTGGGATLTFTLTNPSGNSGTLSGVGFSSTIPANLSLTTPGTTCGGTAAIGGGTISLSGGSVAAGASCTVTANASSTNAGSYSITPGAPSSTSPATTGVAGSPATLTVTNPAPTVSSITPSGGSTGGGTPVTITGTNFRSGDTYSATFGASPVTATYASATTLTASTPAGTGAVSVTVTDTTTSQAGTGSATYTYAAPTVTGLSVTSGPANATRTVTITGTNFTPTATVAVGGTSATAVSYNSATQLTATLPAKTAGTYDVLVTTGTVTTAATSADQYTYVAAPTVTNVTPNAGSTNGGTAVTVTGTNLTGATSVTFGGDPATNVVVAGDGNSLTATTPAGTAGAKNVAVTTPGGTGTLAGSYTYAAAPSAPTISLPANNATVATTTPLIGGSSQAGVGIEIFVDGTSAGTTTAGAGATWGVTVNRSLGQGSHTAYAVATTAGGSSPNSNSVTFTVDTVPPAAPVITAPANGATIATQTPTITGTAEANSTVTIAFDTGTGGGTTTANGSGAFSFTATAALAYGSRTVSATARDAASNTGPTATSSFTIAQAPTVSSVTPNQGSTAGGQQITIAGSGFTGVNPATGVTVGGTAATNVTVTATQITATTPAGTAGATTVAVTNAAGQGTAAYTYVGAPTANNQSVSAAYNTATAITLTGSDPNSPPRALTYAIQSGPSHGTLSGAAPNLTFTPTAGYAGPDSFTFTVNNGTSSSAPATVSITVAKGNQTISFTSTAPNNAAVGGTYNVNATATSGLTVSLTIDASASSTCSISGGTVSFNRVGTCVIDANQGGNATYDAAPQVQQSIAVAVPTIAIAPSTLPAASVGAAYSQTLTASGGTAPYTYSETGALPAGVTLSMTGVLSGTPTMAGDYSFSVTATDTSNTANGGPYSGTATYTLHVGSASVIVEPANGFSNGQVGVAYSQQASASGGTGPYHFSISGGALPAGITLSTGGALSGTPTAGGSFTFTLTATDSSTGAGAPFSGSRQYTLMIAAPTIDVTPTALSDANTNIFYSQSLTASGGTAPYTFSITAGALPAGITLSTNGIVSGTATQAGSYTFTVKAADSSTGTGAPYSQTRSYTLTVTTPSIVIAPPTLPNPKVGTTYSQTLSASGGSGGYTYSVTAGALPAGISLSTGGVVSGTPTAGGNFTFTVQATDSNGNKGTRSYTLTDDAATLTIAPATVPNATTRIAYSQTITTSGGTAPYSYAVTAGALPAGITLATSGTLSGSATTAGSYTFTVTTRDASTGSGPYTAAQSYTLTVAAPAITIAPPALPDATTKVSYNQTLTASGGTGPYSFAVTAGALPAGISLATDGTFSGKPAAAGQSTFTVTATDANGNANAQGYTLTVTAPAITLAPTSLPNAVTGSVYSASITASGGTAPYSFAVTAGALPTGVNLATSGALSGTPSAGGTFTFTVTGTDANGNSAARSYSVTVGAAQIQLAPASLPAGAYNTAYSQQISASGGTAPYSYAVTAGALPAGITLSSSGLLSGTTTQNGSFTFSVTATDSSTGSGPYTGIANYTLTISAPPAPTAAATSATVAYNTAKAIDLSGSISGVHNSIAISTAPTHGTTSVSGDVVTYTPASGYYGSDSFAYTATGPGGTSAPATVSLTIAAPAITIAPASLPNGQQDAAYSATLSASGGTAPYSYAVTGGALPAGLTLSASGTISGTPTTNGSFPVTITATDSSTGTGPARASQAYTLQIAPPAPPTARDGAATVSESVTGNQSVTIDLSALISGNVADVQIASAPLHGTVTINRSAATTQALGTAAASPRFTATYTPNAGYQGQDRFTFVAVGPGGTSAPAAVNITVVGIVPTAANVTTTTGQNQAVSVDITSGAVGGPFTTAAIVSVSPAASVTAALIEGGTASARTYRLQITPSARFSGTAVVIYTLGNVFGSSAPATVTVTVTGRPDPSSDPVVRGLVDAEATATRDFARTQLGNFNRRTEQLHNGGGASDPVGVSVSLPTGGSIGGRSGTFRGTDNETALKMEHANAVAGAERAAYGQTGRRGLATGFSARATQTNGAPVTANGARLTPGDDVGGDGDTVSDVGDGTRKIGQVAIWSGGAIDVGTRDATTRRARLSISSSGLSAGADVRLTEGLTVGAGGGIGEERTRIGTNDAGHLTADNWVAALYGSLTPMDGAFVDGVIGYGDLRFDTRRATLGGTIALGHRDGSMVFGSLSAGIDRSSGTFRYSGYGRVEYLSAGLHSFAESGAGAYNLTFDHRTLESLSSVLGGRASFEAGSLTPRARFEWRHEFNRTGDQLLDYADLGGPSAYRIADNGWLRDEFQLEIGFGLNLGGGWTSGFDVGGRIGEGSRAATGRVTIEKKF